MPHVHLTFDLLEAHARGDLDERDLMWIVIRHLRADCGDCDVEIQTFEDEVAEASGEPRPAGEVSPEARGLFAAFAERLQDLLRQAEKAAVRSPGEVRELIAQVESESELWPDGRDLEAIAEAALAKVRRARTRFRSLPLAVDLLDEVRASLPDRPRRALALARLAETVVWRVPDPDGLLRKLRGCLAGLALAHQANALRVLDDLRGADRVFEQARGVLDHHGVADADVLGEVDSLEGSLRRDQRRLPEAEWLLLRAVALWTAANEPLGLARAMLKVATFYFHCGRPVEALAEVEAALATLPEQAPARLRLCAVHNRIFYLCDLGYFEVAADYLAEARTLYATFSDPWTLSRLAWVEGKIAAGLGLLHQARERLETAREGFSGAGALYDTALLSLELAALFLEEGRAADARRVASQALTLFDALEIPREAAAALAQLRQAAGDEAEQGLTPAIVREATRALRSAHFGG